MSNTLNDKTPQASFPKGNFIVLDFESTCSDSEDATVPRNEMEVIEVGAIAVSPDLTVISEFSSFVQPVRHPLLTDFCKGLTSIQQEDVDGAERFPFVSSELAFWAADHDVEWWGSWGKYDRNQLTQDLEFHRVPDPLSYPHFNLKAIFSERQELKRRLGLSGALKVAGLQFEGTAHRAIDDTRNIVRLLPWILGDSAVATRKFQGSDVEEGMVP